MGTTAVAVARAQADTSSSPSYSRTAASVRSSSPALALTTGVAPSPTPVQVEKGSLPPNVGSAVLTAMIAAAAAVTKNYERGRTPIARHEGESVSTQDVQGQ